MRTLPSSKPLWLKLIKPTEIFEEKMLQKMVQQVKESD